MLQRKPSKVPGKALPKDWTDSVSELFNQTYKAECDARGRHFEVHGQIFPTELCVVVGLNPPQDSTEAAVTCFLSSEADDIATPAAVKATQENLVGLAGMFFDEVFRDAEWNEWEPNWQEVEWLGKKYFYKMTRENVTLTLAADRLLQESGFVEDVEIDEEEDEDQTLH